MSKSLQVVFMAILALSLAVSPAPAEEAADRVGDAYALNVCAVSGEEIGSMGEGVVHVKDGREVRFCCGGCTKKYDTMTEQFSAAVDEKMIADQESHYPLKTCPVSGAELTAEAKTFVAGNREFKTCCGNCAKAVKAEPAKFIEKLDAAVKEQQAAAYALKTCPVSGKAVEGAGVEVVVANRLVRLCCEGCKKGVEKDPAAAVAKVDEAAKAPAKS